MQYGTLAFRSSLGLNIHLQTSNLGASESFALGWRQLQNRAASVQEGQSNPGGEYGLPTGSEVQARKVLGVSHTAPLDEITAAYRRLAPMYHPDNVARLAPEFQILAETRMKELNVAYDFLKRHDTQSA